jgi:hypothetical protein
VNGLILLIVDADRTPPMAGEDHAPPTTDGDHTHPMIDAGHTRHTTAAGTVQGLHIATGDVGHLPMTDPLHPTGADIDLSPGHPVLLQGAEAGAIPAVYRQREATHEAAPQCQKDRRATLQRKGVVERNTHAADLLARGVVQGKAILIAAARTLGLSLESAQLELQACVLVSLVRIRCALYPWKLMYVKRLYVGTLKSELSVAWDVCILLYYVYFV